jgi:hypothetical protein
MLNHEYQRTRNSGSGSGNTPIPTPGNDCEASVEMRRQTRELRASMVDALTDRYVDWREECFAVIAAYQRWSEADVDDRADAFAAYSAALDREERACDIYAELVRDVRRTALASARR